MLLTVRGSSLFNKVPSQSCCYACLYAQVCIFYSMSSHVSVNYYINYLSFSVANVKCSKKISSTVWGVSSQWHEQTSHS